MLNVIPLYEFNLMLAFILGLLLLGAAIVTDISADFLGYNMPIFVKYICFGASIVSLIYSYVSCHLYTSPSPRDRQKSRMPSSA